MATKAKQSQYMKGACRVIEEQIRRTWGNGWDHLSDTLRRAVVTERVFYVFAGRPPEDTTTADQLASYNFAVLEHMGLRDADEGDSQ